MRKQIEMMLDNKMFTKETFISFEICSGVAFPYPLTEELYIQRQNLFLRLLTPCSEKPLYHPTQPKPITKSGHIYFSFLLFF